MRLTVGDIESQHKELTGPQWKLYSQQLIGKEIMFAGEVVTVLTDGVLVAVVLADVTRTEILTTCFLGGISSSTVSLLTEGELLRGEGIVMSVAVFEGDLAVWIRVVRLDGYMGPEGNKA